MNELTFAQLKPLLKADLLVGQTPALLGKPGIGKSALIEDLGRLLKTKVFTLPVNQLADRADLTGVRLTQDDEGNWRQSFFPHETIMSAITYAEEYPDETPILFLDEFNRASSDITSAILSFQTLRRIGTFNFPDNLRLIVAGNDKGNVTSLDQASITRFSVYHVTADIDTFFSVQTLNPFVKEVLDSNPEYLLANQLSTEIESEDGDDDDLFSIEEEFLEGDGFEQQTVPRTITYTSEWLNGLGIDQSGSDEEVKLLGELLTESVVEDSATALHAGLIAHAGNTEFTHALYNNLRDYLTKAITGPTDSSKGVVANLRPDQDIINRLSRTQDTSEVDELVQGLNDNDKAKLLVWLFETKSVKEIDNNNAVQASVREIVQHIDELTGENISGFYTLLSKSTNISNVSMSTFLESDSDISNTYKDFISSVF